MAHSLTENLDPRQAAHHSQRPLPVTHTKDGVDAAGCKADTALRLPRPWGTPGSPPTRPAAGAGPHARPPHSGAVWRRYDASSDFGLNERTAADQCVSARVPPACQLVGGRVCRQSLHILTDQIRTVTTPGRCLRDALLDYGDLADGVPRASDSGARD